MSFGSQGLGPFCRICAVSLGLLAGSPASADPVADMIAGGWLSPVAECDGVAWLKVRDGAQVGCEIEARGHRLVAASAGDDIAPNYLALELAEGGRILVAAMVTDGAIDVVTGVQNAETDAVLILYDPQTAPVGLSVANATRREMSPRDANGLIAALTGAFGFDLSPIGLALGDAAGPPCGRGGPCPEIACWRTAIGGPLFRAVMFDTSQRAHICDTLAEWEGAPHPEGPPDATLVRRLLIRALHRNGPEETNGVAWIEHTLSGMRLSVLNPVGRPLQFSASVGEVQDWSCTGGGAVVTCTGRVPVAYFSRSNMPESLQSDFFESMFRGDGIAELDVSLRRVGARWQFESDPWMPAD